LADKKGWDRFEGFEVMKIKDFLFWILFFSCFTYGKMSTVTVSPFVIRGFSYSFALSNFPVYDYNFGNRNNYGPWSEIEHLDKNKTILDSRMFYENSWFANDFFSVGIRDRAEIEFMLGLPFMISSQIKVNAFTFNGRHEFFRDISISPFLGQFFQEGVHDYNDFYGGISIGTRRIANNRFFVEFYSSPMIYSSKHTILANNTNPQHYGKVDILSLNIPMGTRMLVGRTRKFSCDLGITPIIRLKESWLETSPIAIFTKMSFHLGRESRLWK
jgi:hypothetical protein